MARDVSLLRSVCSVRIRVDRLRLDARAGRGRGEPVRAAREDARRPRREGRRHVLAAGQPGGARDADEDHGLHPGQPRPRRRRVRAGAARGVRRRVRVHEVRREGPPVPAAERRRAGHGRRPAGVQRNLGPGPVPGRVEQGRRDDAVQEGVRRPAQRRPRRGAHVVRGVPDLRPDVRRRPGERQVPVPAVQRLRADGACLRRGVGDLPDRRDRRRGVHRVGLPGVPVRGAAVHLDDRNVGGQAGDVARERPRPRREGAGLVLHRRRVRGAVRHHVRGQQRVVPREAVGVFRQGGRDGPGRPRESRRRHGGRRTRCLPGRAEGAHAAGDGDNDDQHVAVRVLWNALLRSQAHVAGASRVAARDRRSAAPGRAFEDGADDESLRRRQLQVEAILHHRRDALRVLQAVGIRRRGDPEHGPVRRPRVLLRPGEVDRGRAVDGGGPELLRPAARQPGRGPVLPRLER